MTQTYKEMLNWAEQNEKEAESKEQAKDKWEQGDYIGFERKEGVSEQFEGVKENE